MKRKALSSLLFTLLLSRLAGQSEEAPGNDWLSGFIRGGFYIGQGGEDKNKMNFSSSFADFCLKSDLSSGMYFSAHADIRYRFGVEFNEPVSSFDLREAFVRAGTDKFNITAGQQIIAWGRADFTNPTSSLSPLNLVSRSPDREDMKMGNLIGQLKFIPADWLRLEADLVPYHRPSVLVTEPFSLPEGVELTQDNELKTGEDMFSYGLRADMELNGFSLGLSWYNGYDPMPGIALTSFTFDLSSGTPAAETRLSTKPYRTKVAGIDFETNAGNTGLRGELAYSVPELSYLDYEYVPLPEIAWAAGADRSCGIFHFTAEYSGKYMTTFTPASAEPILGTEPDYTELLQYLSVPGFDPSKFVRDQVGAFNRLYNYQLKRVYHSFAARIEGEFLFSKAVPSFFTMYNFVSKEVLLIPELKLKPADGITITTGAELYYGSKGSLYDLIGDFMNNAYLSLRFDF